MSSIIVKFINNDAKAKVSSKFGTKEKVLPLFNKEVFVKEESLKILDETKTARIITYGTDEITLFCNEPKKYITLKNNESELPVEKHLMKRARFLMTYSDWESIIFAEKLFVEKDGNRLVINN